MEVLHYPPPHRYQQQQQPHPEALIKRLFLLLLLPPPPPLPPPNLMMTMKRMLVKPHLFVHIYRVSLETDLFLHQSLTSVLSQRCSGLLLEWLISGICRLLLEVETWSVRPPACKIQSMSYWQICVVSQIVVCLSAHHHRHHRQVLAQYPVILACNIWNGPKLVDSIYIH